MPDKREEIPPLPDWFDKNMAVERRVLSWDELNLKPLLSRRARLRFWLRRLFHRDAR